MAAASDLVRLSVSPTTPTPCAMSEVILAVDDEDVVRGVTVRMLRKAGYEVVEACDGREALEVLERDPEALPHLVLTDLNMPAMTGRELGDAIASRYPSLPVLYMSGYTKDELSRRGFLGGGHTLLQKPFTYSELIVAVRQMLATGALTGEAG